MTPSASIRPPALVRSQSSWSIAGAHYKHWATLLGNFGVTPFFGGSLLSFRREDLWTLGNTYASRSDPRHGIWVAIVGAMLGPARTGNRGLANKKISFKFVPTAHNQTHVHTHTSVYAHVVMTMYQLDFSLPRNGPRNIQPKLRT